MNMKSFGLGPHRWHIEATPSTEMEAREFHQWMKENFPTCFLKLRSVNMNNGKYFWEIRGSDKQEHSAIMLSWV